MADLPDLDTSNVAFLAFWNAIDQGGVSDIDPTEVTSAPGVQSYTLYDNGLEGEYALSDVDNWSADTTDDQTGDVVSDSNPGTAGFRVKEDGWMVAWSKQGENFGTDQTSPLGGTWDAFKMQDPTNRADANNHNLARLINSLRAEFSNSGTMNYSASDVGLSAYHASGTTTSVLSYDLYQTGGGTETYNPDLTYTNLTRNWHVIGGATAGYEYDRFWGYVSWEGNDLANPANNGTLNPSYGYGVLDAIANPLAPNEDTTYQGTVYGKTSNTGQQTYCNLTSLMVWE